MSEDSNFSINREFWMLAAAGALVVTFRIQDAVERVGETTAHRQALRALRRLERHLCHLSGRDAVDLSQEVARINELVARAYASTVAAEMAGTLAPLTPAGRA